VQLKPFWGPATSNVNWCESDYEFSSYIAEYYNTISNIPMIFLGLFGLYQGYICGLEVQFLYSYCFIFIIGVGSTMFHATLLYHFQLLDELPMILGSLIFIYCMIDMQLIQNLTKVTEKSKRPMILNLQRKILIFALFSYGIATCVIMAMYIDSPVPMNVSYAIMVVFIVFCSIILYRTSKDSDVKKFFWFSFCSYLIGALFWITEKNFCGNYPGVKYFHAYWHIGAGVGTYIFIFWVSYLHAHQMKLLPEVRYAFDVLPFVAVSRKE